MSEKDSVFVASLKGFFVSLFALLGLVVGIFVITLVVGLVSTSSRREVNVPGHYTVMPDANGATGQLRHHTPVVLHVDIRGFIGADDMTPDKLYQLLNRSQQGALKNRIKAIFLRIDSPGGISIDSDSMYQLLKDYREKHEIPVYAFVDGLCASGGYFIGCAANKIYASKASVVGSVGIIGNFVNVSDGLKKIGVEALVLSRGKDKDPLNPIRPWKEGEAEQPSVLIDYFYKQFTETVAENRPALTVDLLENKYGARVFPAQIAVENGYIDHVSNSRSEVLAALVEEAGIADDYQVVRLDQRAWLDTLWGFRSALSYGKVACGLDLPDAVKAATQSGYLYFYQP